MVIRRIKHLFIGMKNNKYLDIGNNSIFNLNNLTVRSEVDKIFMKIGDNSLIEGKFVIENQRGIISIGDRTFIGGGLFVSIIGIDIGDDVMFSWGCTVMDNDAHSLNWNDRINDVLDWKKGIDYGKIGYYKDWSKVECEKIVIENKVWVGFNSIILKGVTIGEGAVIAAGSVVTKDVEPYTLVAGNPARFIKKLK